MDRQHFPAFYPIFQTDGGWGRGGLHLGLGFDKVDWPHYSRRVPQLPSGGRDRQMTPVIDDGDRWGLETISIHLLRAAWKLIGVG